MLALYHFPQAICAQKVRVGLAEKDLKWESISAQGQLRSSQYLNLNPNGYVPTLVHNDDVIIESRVINEYLEDAFETPPLLSRSPVERARARLWTKQIDDSLHLNVFVITCAVSYRHVLEKMSPEARALALPLNNPIKRQYALDLVKRGFDSEYFPTAIARFEALLSDMEKTLSKSTWLAGNSYSLADADFTPYIRRLDDVGFWGLRKHRFVEVARWYEAVQARPSFKLGITDWLSSEDSERENKSAAIAIPHFASVLADLASLR